ncbi:hypothetical protein HGRIS_010405 [Hohenbuehelia grisea]|uniref:U6 small nuclear RNA (adenine-(43)-N(6))-methyltransferase n=1 Tax=Hohenbuehelia grisea TaxID=104357 RepID=A0ABR3J4W9_9AGAR
MPTSPEQVCRLILHRCCYSLLSLQRVRALFLDICDLEAALHRLNYIQWLEALLRVTAEHWNLSADSTSSPTYPDNIRGIDIGTGASAIYPLLGCKRNPTWSFTATDIDEKSLRYAQANVEANKLHDRICMTRTDPDGPIFAPLTLDIHARYDFTMCNPPFYEGWEDQKASAEGKDLSPSAVCTGSEVEMITFGGESHFVGRMIEESVQLRERCCWYTSMLGKMTSLIDVVEALKQQLVTNYAVTELVQGQTRRWVIAWSYNDIRLPDSVGRLSTSSPVIQSIIPLRNTLLHNFSCSTKEMQNALEDVLGSIVGSRTIRRDEYSQIVRASRNTWSRKARRATHHEMAGSASNSDEAGLVCLLTSISDSGMEDGVALQFQWVKGQDYGLFEGFTSHVARKMKGRLAGQDKIR